MWNVFVMKVLEMESVFASPAYSREDLAGLLRSVQVQEKEKLHLVCHPPCNWIFISFSCDLQIFCIRCYA